MMSSQTLRWETLQAIKNSSKGRITFDPHWYDRGEDILHGYVETLSLSYNSGLILDRMNLLTPPETPPLSSSSGSSPPGPSQEGPALNLKLDSSVDGGGTPRRTPPIPTLSLLSPRDMQINRCIIAFEEVHREKAKAALRMRQQLQEEADLSIARAVSEQLKRLEELLEFKQRQEKQSRRDLRDRQSKESMAQQKQLKEAHRRKTKILNKRVRESVQQRVAELEQQRVREAELERQRQAEPRKRLKKLNNIQEEILQLNQIPGPSTHTTQHPLAGSHTTRGNQLCSQVSGVVRKTAEGQFPGVEDTLHNSLQSFEELNSSQDKQTKRLKMELHKAATTPVCQISTTSGSLIKGIFEKIDNLLSGGSFESGGKSFSTSQHPQGLDLVSYKIAERFVTQGDEEVASHHESAFPIAVVACGVWEHHPKVGDLIMAHLHKRCPYSIPHYPPMKEGMSVKEHQEMLGYHVYESGVEDQEHFLTRMSGMIRLYAAIIQLRWPFDSKQEAVPHGLNHGWRWLAQMLNMAPVVDITATLLYNFLEVCGHALVQQYQNQFWKLVILLKEEYLPRIEAVTSPDQRARVCRLRDFIQASLQKKTIDPPKGYLSSSFWWS